MHEFWFEIWCLINDFIKNLDCIVNDLSEMLKSDLPRQTESDAAI